MATCTYTHLQNGLKSFAEVNSFINKEIRAVSFSKRLPFGDRSKPIKFFRFQNASGHRKFERSVSEIQSVSAAFPGDESYSKEELRWKREEERWRRENERWEREEDRWEREEQRWNRMRTLMLEKEANLQNQINQIKDLLSEMSNSQQDVYGKMRESTSNKSVEEVNSIRQHSRTNTPTGFTTNASERFDGRLISSEREFDFIGDYELPTTRQGSTQKYKLPEKFHLTNEPETPFNNEPEARDRFVSNNKYERSPQKFDYLDEFDPAKYQTEPYGASQVDKNDGLYTNKDYPSDFSDKFDVLESRQFTASENELSNDLRSLQIKKQEMLDRLKQEFPHKFSPSFDFSDEFSTPKPVADFDPTDDFSIPKKSAENYSFSEQYELSRKSEMSGFNLQNFTTEPVENNGSYFSEDEFNPRDMNDVDKLISDLKAKKANEAKMNRDININNDAKMGKKLQIPKGWKVLDILSEGEDVTKMQDALRSLGFIICKEELEMSYFSFDTETAYKRWQSSIGVEPNGIVTYNLFNKLMEEADM